MNRPYILASGSPRRIEMMRANGFNPQVMPSDIDESLPLHHGMTETAAFLALKKARDVERHWLADALQNSRPADSALPPVIIAADTIVYYDGEIMGKPADKEDGFRMLSALRGQVHDVVTGVALVEAGMQKARVFYEITRVFFTDYSDADLLAYLDTEEAYDKAGGYAIQGHFARYIDHIEGDYDNVVGFPWKRIMEELKQFD